jgi:hypothetical protein
VQIIAQHSGRCLDIVGGNPNPTTPTHQWSCVNVPWQQWDIIPFDTTYHFIKNKNTQLCLDVPNGIPSDGLQLWQYTCNNTDAQKFTVPSCVGCWGEMRTKLSPGQPRCVDVRGASQADGAVIQLWPCNGTGAQRWQAGIPMLEAPPHSPVVGEISVRFPGLTTLKNANRISSRSTS